MSELADFARNLRDDVEASAEAERTTRPEAFTRSVLEMLELAGVTGDTFTAYRKSRGIEVHGYAVSESGETLDLFTTDFDPGERVEKLARDKAELAFHRLIGFLAACEKGLAGKLDESLDVHDMSTAVSRALREVSRVRLFLLTNKICSVSAVPGATYGDLPVVREVWDLGRLYRNATAGSIGEPIEVTFDPHLPCISAQAGEADHEVTLALVQGERLADLYAEHGARLLELNVRSFLQAKGMVNRGIRETLVHTPQRFLAYNNGVTATASEVRFVRDDSGHPRGIVGIRGLQIVNGGQTTASLHYAKRQHKADLSEVMVQMKLTQVPPELLSEIVPKISMYSNTQNRVTLVDFSSNHEFHVDVQRITRGLWAPTTDGSGKETLWFYERARGQYTDELAKARTPARRRDFKGRNPSQQRFTKEQLAKYVNSWNRFPYLVCRGAQKNFVEFMSQVDRVPPSVDKTYCQRLIAMAILFRAIDRIAASHGARSYKSMVTAHTMGSLSLATDRRIDLDRIWREQRISPAVEAAVDELCPLVMKVVTNPLEGNHVGEWAKKEACWDEVSRIRWEIPPDLKAELRNSPLDGEALESDGKVDSEASVEVAAVPAVEWFAIARWAKETGLLSAAQRQAVEKSATRLEASGSVPESLAARALRARRAALGGGFSLEQ